ncbi:hypothetical protein [Prauserella halophila]|nr:hypothetical protein [Prauserella halophila]MCP2237474.1 hypothetical protein [Prauserella halophila]
MGRIPDIERSRLKAEVSVQRLMEGCGVTEMIMHRFCMPGYR